MTLVNQILLSSAGAVFLCFIIARIIPNDKLRVWGVTVGKLMTGWFTLKLGRPFWLKLEDFLENSAGAFLEGLREGLDSDDKDPAQEQPK